MTARAPAVRRLSGQIRQTASDGIHGLAVELFRPGQSELSGRMLWTIGQVAVAGTIVLVNLLGVLAVLTVSFFVVPLPVLPPGQADHLKLLAGIVTAAYLAFTLPGGAVLGIRRLWSLRQFLLADRPATEEEQELVLSAPLRLALIQTALWAAAALLFGGLATAYSTELGARVATMVSLTGATTGACAYLLTERLMRPVAARALASADARRFRGRGVATRALLAWAFGSGVPVLGLGAIGVFVLAGQQATLAQVALAVVVLCGTALTVGFLAVGLAARATADPIDSVREALARVQDGDYSVRVPVYDGTQVGLLQRGFNQMVGGLAERERIREAFGTYVDPEVAEHVLREGTALEGDDVEVTMMFLDVRDFTGFAEAHAAREVVATLNRLFAAVVPVIHAESGWIDKFIGDGLLAVFGAPRRVSDHADHGLAAAVRITEAVASVELEVGIGLNSGTVVAGNVGAPGRVEFSVIGDAVNVAARIEAATRETGDGILIADRTRELLRNRDTAGGRAVVLERRDGVELKGKREPVALWAVRPRW